MAEGQRTNEILVNQARQGLDRLKQEVASEIGVQLPQGGAYLGDLPSRVNGAIGGNMVRRMIAAAEQALIQQAAGQVTQTFRQAAGLPGQPAQVAGQQFQTRLGQGFQQPQFQPQGLPQQQ